ncbi:dihydrofolate reductase family protein [Arsenicicoccus dermatophilus]|nr:dihydrofolate reductase family protein [Arsenicicoccus dermatophilus]
MDGFIADPHGDFSAFPQDPATLAVLFDRYPETCPAHLRDVLGVTGAPRRFDTVIMGYRTYEPALAVGLPGGVYPHLRQVVATHRDLPEATILTTMSGDLPRQVALLKGQPGRDIWLCGGATLAAQLVDQIDEVQIKVNPVTLGAGIPLLPAPGAARAFRLAGMEELPGGIALLTYRSESRRGGDARRSAAGSPT